MSSEREYPAAWWFWPASCGSSRRLGHQRIGRNEIGKVAARDVRPRSTTERS